MIRIGCEDCEAGKDHFSCNLPNDDPAAPNITNQRLLSHPYTKRLKRYVCEKCGIAKCSKHLVMIHIQKEHTDDECLVIGIGCKLCEAKESHEVASLKEILKRSL